MLIMMHNNNNNSLIQFRSHSQEKLIHTPNHRRSNSSHSADLFTLVIPTQNGSSLSSLVCPICSLPMMKPTLLPCQHTFCFQCIQNSQQTRPGSLPTYSSDSLSSADHQIKTITCQKCSCTHRINSLTDLEQNQSVQLLINTLLCETCHQLYPSNQLDTCFHCFEVLCPKCYEQHLEKHQNQLTINRKLYRVVSVDETVDSQTKTIIPDKDQTLQEKQIFRSKSVHHEKKSVMKKSKQHVEIEHPQDENCDPADVVNARKKSSIFHYLRYSSRQRHSAPSSTKDPLLTTSPSSVKRSCSAKLPRQSKMSIDINIDEISKIESTPTIVPITPVSRFRNFNEHYTHATQHIQQCKQRQLELDRSVRKLIEVLTVKTNETINQISQYWIQLKQLALDQFQEKSNRFQLFDYLLKTCCSTAVDSRKHMEAYFEQNDEIKAALQVLLTTLVIVKQQQTVLIVNQSFDREEQTTIGRLRRHLELLLSSYSDDLSFVLERINVYETRFAAWKNCSTTDLDSITYEWSQIIEHDYPSLIEKVSNDFISKLPQTEKILVEMMRNMKKRLITTDNQGTSQRTTVVNL